MYKFLDILEAVFVAIIALLGVISIVAGFFTWLFHCFILGGMCLSLANAWYYETYTSKGKSLWQKKSSKNK